MSEVRQRVESLSRDQLQRLSERLVAKKSTAPARESFGRHARTGEIPLSSSQEGIWLQEQLGALGSMFNEPICFRFEGSLNTKVFERCLGEVIQRHEVLRTRIVTTADGRAAQCIDPLWSFKLPVADISAVDESQRAGALDDALRAETQQAFNLQTGPLFRALLIKESSHSHVFCWTVHHIIWDFQSIPLFVRELLLLYSAYTQNRPSPLEPLSAQYADYSIWQKQRLQSEGVAKQRNYWRQQLQSAPPALDLPIDKPRPPVPSYSGERLDFMIADDVRESVLRLGKEQSATTYMTMLAAFQCLLARLSGQTDIIVGSPFHGRNTHPSEKLLGFFANVLPMRVELGDDPSFRQLLQRVKVVALSAFSSADIPLEQLVALSPAARDASRQPLFQVCMSLQRNDAPPLPLPGLSVSLLAAEHVKSKFDLTIELFESASDIRGRFEYATDLFERSTAERMLAHFQQLLGELVKNPDERISKVRYLGSTELHELIIGRNESAAEYPRQATIQQLFREWAALQPDSIALTSGGRQLTYSELDRRSDELARALIHRGVSREERVALYMERSIEMIVAFLGVMKAGAAYLVIDTEYPAERVQFLLDDAAVSTVLSVSTIVDRFPSALKPLLLDSDDWIVSGLPVEPNETINVCAENLACVIYTSGTTGKPKGTLITHRGIIRLVRNNWFMPITSDDNFAHVASPAFDATSIEVWGGLLNGARVTILDAPALSTAQEFSQQLKTHEVTSLFLTTSLFNRYATDSPTMFNSLRYVAFGGEAADPVVVQRLSESSGPQFLVNCYGPTENSTCSTTYMIPKGWRGTTVPIGQPVSNSTVYVLDENLEPVSTDVIGELYVGGDGLARGYLNRPSLTAATFIADPFSSDGGRLYRTGDRVKWRAEGYLEYHGRADSQVKIRGFRIELGEIEVALKLFTGVRAVAVIVHADAAGVKRIAAYIEMNADAFDQNALREYLRKSLPEYMIPSAFVRVDELPLTTNGKLDRKRLPTPETAYVQVGEYVAPETELEQTLAGVWRSVLNLERVGIDDDFFDLGGDSITAIQVVAKATQAGVRLKVRTLLENPTIRALAKFATSRARSTSAYENLEGFFALTPIQRWLFEHSAKTPNRFNMVQLLLSKERLEPNMVSEAVRALVEHHDALRTRFSKVDGAWIQEITSPADLRSDDYFRLRDLSRTPLAEQYRELTRATQEAQDSLNIEAGPMLKAVLFDFGENLPQRLFLVAHHLVVDAVSLAILVEDLQLAYEQRKGNEALQLPAKSSSFKSWSERQLDYSTGGGFETDAAFWSSMPWDKVAPLPIDFHDGVNSIASTANVESRLGNVESQALLRAIGADRRIRPVDALLAGVARAFCSFAERDVMLLDLESHGREELFEDIDASRTVGWFTSMYPTVLNLPEGDWKSATLAVADQLKALPRNGIGFGALRYLTQNEFFVRLPRAEVSFNYLGSGFGKGRTESLFESDMGMLGGINSIVRSGELCDLPIPEDARNLRPHRICIDGGLIDGTFQFIWRYSENVHRRSTIQGLVRRFEDFLREIAAAAASESMDTAVAHSLSSDPTRADVAPVGAGESLVPLTPIQHKVIEWMGDGFRSNIICTPLECKERIDPESLELALRKLVAHHDTLRLKLLPESGSWRQSVVDAERMAGVPLLESFDLSALDAGAQRQQVERITGDLIAKIDVGTASIVRAALLNLGPQAPQKLLLAIHHFAFDPASLHILLEDLEQGFRSAHSGKRIELTPTTTPYGQWAKKLANYARSPQIQEEVTFWRSKPWERIKNLPRDRGVDGEGEKQGASLITRVEREQMQTVLAGMRRQGMRIEEYLLTALAHSVSEWTNWPVVWLDVMRHGRVDLFDDVDVSRTVGWFSTEAPILLDYSGANPTDLIRITRQQLRAIPSEGIGFGVLKFLRSDEVLKSVPAPEVRLNHIGQIARPQLFQLLANEFAAPKSLRPDRAVELRTSLADGALNCTWVFDGAALDLATIESLDERFKSHLRKFSTTHFGSESN